MNDPSDASSVAQESPQDSQPVSMLTLVVLFFLAVGIMAAIVAPMCKLEYQTLNVLMLVNGGIVAMGGLCSMVPVARNHSASTDSKFMWFAVVVLIVFNGELGTALKDDFPKLQTVACYVMQCRLARELTGNSNPQAKELREHMKREGLPLEVLVPGGRSANPGMPGCVYEITDGNLHCRQHGSPRKINTICAQRPVECQSPIRIE